MLFTKKAKDLPEAGKALPGRENSIPTASEHFVFNRPLKGPIPNGFERIEFGLGCFWGAERIFWQRPGVWLTSVGYAGGETPNPTYEEVCSGQTGHTEIVEVIFDPSVIPLADLLALFWESHIPTQGMRQGNDIGTQYRSAIYTSSEEQLRSALASKEAYQSALSSAGRADLITTEIKLAGPYYYAEDYHQQYLAKNPNGYCGIGGTGVSCPVDFSKRRKTSISIGITTGNTRHTLGMT